jgi:NAD(P)-dependent dehydrogenase (short-subunit alcohol dehydrogenase family)
MEERMPETARDTGTRHGDLTGKVAVVTGAASGIGRATVALFAREGAKVVAADRNESLLRETLSSLADMASSVASVRADVANENECRRMVETAVSTFGALDVLVNNAGIMDLTQPVGALDLEVWRRVLAVNLDGPMFAMRAAVPLMLAAGGGAIVNIASVAGLGGGSAGAAYTASKHGLIGLTLNTAWMYAKRGIRCNAVAAGGVATNIMDSIDQSKVDPAGFARASEYYPLMPATLEPADIARLVLFLAGDGARMINGAIIPADAGWRAA